MAAESTVGNRKIFKKLFVLEYARREGEEKGIEKGKTTVVTNLLTAKKFTISEIANYAAVSEAFVEQVRAGLSGKTK